MKTENQIFKELSVEYCKYTKMKQLRHSNGILNNYCTEVCVLKSLYEANVINILDAWKLEGYITNYTLPEDIGFIFFQSEFCWAEIILNEMIRRSNKEPFLHYFLLNNDNKISVVEDDTLIFHAEIRAEHDEEMNIIKKFFQCIYNIRTFDAQRFIYKISDELISYKEDGVITVSFAFANYEVRDKFMEHINRCGDARERFNIVDFIKSVESKKTLLLTLKKKTRRDVL